jgi:hypothetical protein
VGPRHTVRFADQLESDPLPAAPDALSAGTPGTDSSQASYCVTRCSMTCVARLSVFFMTAKHSAVIVTGVHRTSPVYAV